jgi:stage V sporulation protein B
MRQLLLMAGLIGCLSSCVLFLFAQPISMLLYGEPALTGVLMALSPLSMLFAIQQVQFGLVTGLGVQRRAMPGTIVSSVLTLVVMSALCPMPSVRIFGAVLAMLAGSLVRVIWNAAVLQSAKRAA